MKLIIIFLFILPCFLTAQDSLNAFDRFTEDGYALFKTSAHTFTQPLRWQQDDFETLGYIAAGTGLLYIFDERLGAWIKNRRSPFLDQLEKVGDWGGKPVTATGLSMVFFFYGVFSGNEWSRETGTLLGSTMAVSGLIQTASKTIFGRARPAAKKGNNTYKPFPNSSRYHSFPSGHTTVAVTTALVLGHQINVPVIKYGLYSWAGITMWSRLYSNAHWPTDVFLGAALSYAAFKANLSYINQNKNLFVKNIFLMPAHNGLKLVLTF